MASGSPNHHLDWLGYCVGDCPGAPPLASNFELIGMVGVVRLTGQPSTEVFMSSRPSRKRVATLGEHIFNIAIAEGKSEIQPDGMLDD